MDDRLSLYNMAEQLAKQTGTTTTENEQFLYELVSQLDNAIRTDGTVKVKNFGTFKVLHVKERESIHVNTGERIVIPAHHKVTFKPVDQLAAQINKPFAVFETIEAGDADFAAAALASAAVPADETEDDEPIEGAAVPPLAAAATTASVAAKQQQQKKQSMLPIIIVGALFLLILFFGIRYYFNHIRQDNGNPTTADNRPNTASPDFVMPGDTAAQRAALQQAQIHRSDDSIAGRGIDSTAVAATPQQAKPTPKTENTAPKTTAPATTTEKSNVLARVRMEPGSRLTLLAEKYYGNKIFWVYIYEYNKQKIGTNPNQVRTNMELAIPAKSVYGIDASNPTSIEKARRKQAQLVKQQ